MSDPAKNPGSAWRDWPIDREIVLSRVIDAPRSTVYAAWTDPDQIQVWFGPEGMAIETKEIDLGPGGVWLFDMVAADGTRYSRDGSANSNAFGLADGALRINGNPGGI